MDSKLNKDLFKKNNEKYVKNNGSSNSNNKSSKKHFGEKKEKSGKGLVKSFVNRHITSRSCYELFRVCASLLPETPTSLPSNAEIGHVLNHRMAYAKGVGTDLSYYKRVSRDVIRNIGGTVEPTFRLRSTLFAAATSAAGIITTVIPVSYQNTTDYVAFGNVFDEYQYTGQGNFRVHPTLFLPSATAGTVQTIPYYVGVIDYDDVTALASINQARSFDTSQVTCGFVVPATSHSADICSHWVLHFQGIPDKTWTTTASDLIAAYWKGIIYSGTFPNSVIYGNAEYEISVRFRQLA